MAAESTSQSNSIPNIWIDALSKYKEETGIDLEKEQAGNYRGLAECNSPEDALQLIAGLDAFDNARVTRTRLALSNVFRFVLVFNDAIGELAASLQVPGGKTIFVVFGILLRTAQNMQDRLSALGELLFKFEQFFLRFDLRRGINYPLRDQEVLTRICAQFLHVLALVQKIIRRHTFPGVRGRLQRILSNASHFREALLDNEDIKSEMRRLDELTHLELQMTATQTLVTVQNVQAMMATSVFFRYNSDSTPLADLSDTIFHLFWVYIEGDRQKALLLLIPLYSST
ncbi:hypothetical protein K438DRAFT_1795640 [Mycena galopus ATCC 62051]|nr:hypothetical protein K438DRAFT_1795640 [Mycena galopus ATCC 62051]